MTLRITLPLPDFTIPTELLLFNPRPDDIKQHFKNGDYERKIYTNILLDAHEKELLQELRARQKESNVLLKRSMETRILRYLSHSRGDVVKALEALIITQEWRRTFFTPRLSDALLKEKLNNGLIYFCGRDCGMRPFLVVRAKYAFDKDLKWENTDVANLFAFCMEFAIRYLFLPGKVETLVVLLDLAQVGISQLRNDGLRAIGTLLAKQYVGRLYQMLVVNPPTMLTAIWNFAKGFLSDRQQAKTVFLKKNDAVQGRAARHQLEEQYGGSIPRLTNFYPFTFPPGPFDADYAGEQCDDPVPQAFKCINSRTVKGKLIEDDIIPPTRWDSRGSDILKQLALPYQGEYRSQASVATDFPEDDESVNYQADVLAGSLEEQEGQPGSRPTSVPASPSIAVPGQQTHVGRVESTESKDLPDEISADISEGSRLEGAMSSKPGLSTMSSLRDRQEEKLKKPDVSFSNDVDKDNNSESASTESSTPMTADDAQAALQRVWNSGPSRSRSISFLDAPKSGKRTRGLWCCASSGGKHRIPKAANPSEQNNAI